MSSPLIRNENVISISTDSPSPFNLGRMPNDRA